MLLPPGGLQLRPDTRNSAEKACAVSTVLVALSELPNFADADR